MATNVARATYPARKSDNCQASVVIEGIAPKTPLPPYHSRRQLGCLICLACKGKPVVPAPSPSNSCSASTFFATALYYTNATMAATDAQRRANDAFLTASRNSAISAGIKGQPLNTSRAYKKPQADFIVSRAPCAGDGVLILSAL